jgi:iron-sulfur cluster repair protein YtfE (RIC family)
MLTTIGQPPAPATDAVDLLLECHERIRAFATLATRLATEEAPAEELQHAAGAVLRYFRDALPLHVEDEERSLVPRLHGRDPGLDRALEAMSAEHLGHEAALQEVIRACEGLAHEAGRRTERSAEALARAAERLHALFLQHLAPEEAIVFPAIRRLLPEEERAAILAEIRARRARRGAR